jgi:hypothetical protein
MSDFKFSPIEPLPITISIDREYFRNKFMEVLKNYLLIGVNEDLLVKDLLDCFDKKDEE